MAVYHDGAEGSNNTITVGNGDNTIYGNYGDRRRRRRGE